TRRQVVGQGLDPCRIRQALKAYPTKFLSRLPFAENRLWALSSFFSRRCFFIHACLWPASGTYKNKNSSNNPTFR
ncbi:MAG: hypothetical protein ACP5Q3_06035, partial [bacterium]